MLAARIWPSWFKASSRLDFDTHQPLESQVMAVTDQGSVYSWGLSMDGLSTATIESIANATASNGSSGSNGTNGSYADVNSVDGGGSVASDGEDGGSRALVPKLVSGLQSHRVRRLECGRRHYCAVTFTTYAPLCTVETLSRRVVS